MASSTCLNSEEVSLTLTGLVLVDESFPFNAYYVLDAVLEIVLKFGAVILISPIFLVPGIVVVIIGAFLGHAYMRAQLPAKREASNLRAPVLGHVGSAISGLGKCHITSLEDEQLTFLFSFNPCVRRRSCFPEGVVCAY